MCLQITNKKGVSKSLLSATKRWFITSKPGIGASNQNAVMYVEMENIFLNIFA